MIKEENLIKLTIIRKMDRRAFSNETFGKILDSKKTKDRISHNNLSVYSCHKEKVEKGLDKYTKIGVIKKTEYDKNIDRYVAYIRVFDEKVDKYIRDNIETLSLGVVYKHKEELEIDYFCVFNKVIPTEELSLFFIDPSLIVQSVVYNANKNK